MLTNADITIFNKWLNIATGKEEWKSTQIKGRNNLVKGVNWHMNRKVTLTNSGLSPASVYEVRIPIDADTQGKQYIEEREYKKLTGSNVLNYWTISNGDYFVQGLVAEITIPALLKLPLSSMVTDYSDNRRGGAQHWRLSGAA